MAARVTNVGQINLPMAIWLLHDDYDRVDEPKYISATSLMKPIKQLILASRIPASKRTNDVQDFTASAFGRSLHDSIEKAMRVSYKSAMLRLGIPESVIRKIRIDPTPEMLASDPEIIPIYMEKRLFRKLNGWTIGGKFDLVADGQLFDHKSTSVWAWILGRKDEAYSEQGSIYRWLGPDIITSNTIKINFVFTDWSKGDARYKKDYPSKRIEEKTIPLMPVDETERWIAGRLALIDKHWHSKEKDMPRCTDKELWRSEPVYKYYADETKTDGRATKNFDNDKAAAHAYKAEKGKGIVKEIPGVPKACGYCPVFEICEQRQEYYPDE